MCFYSHFIIQRSGGISTSLVKHPIKCAFPMGFLVLYTGGEKYIAMNSDRYKSLKGSRETFSRLDTYYKVWLIYVNEIDD